MGLQKYDDDEPAPITGSHHADSYDSLPGKTVRQRLIEAGVLTPAEQVAPDTSPIDRPTLRLDPLGHRAVREHDSLREASRGALRVMTRGNERERRAALAELQRRERAGT